MTKDEILKYIMQTPENTNPNILRDILGEGTDGGDLNYNFHLKMFNKNPYNFYNPQSNNNILYSLDPTPSQLPFIFDDLKIADIELKGVSLTGDPTAIVISPDDFNRIVFFTWEEGGEIGYTFAEPISIPVIDGSLLEPDSPTYYAVKPIEGFLIDNVEDQFIIIPTKYNNEEYIKVSQGVIHH